MKNGDLCYLIGKGDHIAPCVYVSENEFNYVVKSYYNQSYYSYDYDKKNFKIIKMCDFKK